MIYSDSMGFLLVIFHGLLMGYTQKTCSINHQPDDKPPSTAVVFVAVSCGPEALSSGDAGDSDDHSTVPAIKT